MDSSTGRNQFSAPSLILRRVQEISKSAQDSIRTSFLKGLSGYADVLFGGLFLSLSIGLGYWAYSHIENETLSKWERKNQPDSVLIDVALKSLQLSCIREGPFWRKVVRTMPSSTEEEGVFWKSSDGNWVAYYAHSEYSIYPIFYCQNCQEAPVAWQPAGRGWKAFEQLVKTLFQNLKKKKKDKTSPVRSLDPRALIY